MLPVVCAWFELWKPRVRFVSESGTRSICCHSLKLTLSRQWRDREAGLEIFLGGRSGEREVIWQLPVLPLKNYLKTYFAFPPQNTPSCEPHAVCRGAAQSRRHLLRLQLQITNKKPFSCSPGTCVSSTNPAVILPSLFCRTNRLWWLPACLCLQRREGSIRAGVITFVKRWQSWCCLPADRPLTWINTFLLLACGGSCCSFSFSLFLMQPQRPQYLSHLLPFAVGGFTRA